MENLNTPSSQFDIQQFIHLFKRRKWLIIFSSISVLILGFLICLFLPLIYEGSALIVTVPQKVPENYVQPTISGGLEDLIRSTLQEITSRTSLEKLVKKFDLYPELREKYPLETVIEKMQEDIVIEEAKIAGEKSRRRKEPLLSFYLKYRGTDPQKVAKVTNALANMFVEKNLKIRTSQADATAKFLATQLQKVYIKLKEREEAIKDFKLTHMGELPEQTQRNVATLTALQQQLQNVEESIRRAEDHATLLKQQIASRRAARRLTQNVEGKTRALNTLTLAELKEKLRILRSRYTENHPDIIALKQMIKNRENELKKLGANSHDSLAMLGDASLDTLIYQLKSTLFEIRQLKEERKKLKDEIIKYQQRIENAPKREQELIELTRDYENLKKTYDSLLQKKLEAEQAAALERRQQGTQFRIIDPAIIPEEPVSPKLNKVLPIIFILAIGGSFGLAFILDLISPKLFDPEDIVKNFGLPVLACIPLLLTEKQQKKLRIRNYILSIIAFAGYGVSLGLFITLLVKGPGIFSDLIF